MNDELEIDILLRTEPPRGVGLKIRRGESREEVWSKLRRVADLTMRHIENAGFISPPPEDRG